MDQTDKHYFITSAFSLVTGFALYKVINSQWKVYKNSEKISLIQQAKIKSVDEPVSLNETVIVKVLMG